MNNIGRALGMLFRFFGRYSKILPYGFAGIFVVSSFFSNWYHKGLAYASLVLAKTLFSAELIINENVHKAILNQGYGLRQFIEIVVAVYMIWIFIKFIAKLQINIAGSQALYGAYFIATLIVFVIEIATVRLIDGHFGFVPLLNGIIFLFMNLTPVFMNIFPSWMTQNALILFLGRNIYKEH